MKRAGAHPTDQRALDGKMEELAMGLQEKVITLRAPEDIYDIEGLTRASRFDELEYQEGWKERRGRLEARFELKPPLVWNGNGRQGRERAAKAPARA